MKDPNKGLIKLINHKKDIKIHKIVKKEVEADKKITKNEDKSHMKSRVNNKKEISIIK